MSRIVKAIRQQRRRRDEYRNSIHYAIAHATSEGERNDLLMLATEQGALV